MANHKTQSDTYVEDPLAEGRILNVERSALRPREKTTTDFTNLSAMRPIEKNEHE